MNITYNIVYADPEGEETIGAVPLCTDRLGCQDTIELRYLINNGPRNVLSETQPIS